MKRKDPLIVGRNSVRDMHHLRLMALLQELVRTWGYTGTARWRSPSWGRSPACSRASWNTGA